MATVVLCLFHRYVHFCEVPVLVGARSNMFCHVRHKPHRQKKKKNTHIPTYTISKFLPGEPLCATTTHLTKAIRMFCSNRRHTWELTTFRSVFRLTLLQNTEKYIGTSRGLQLAPRPAPVRTGCYAASNSGEMIKV